MPEFNSEMIALADDVVEPVLRKILGEQFIRCADDGTDEIIFYLEMPGGGFAGFFVERLGSDNAMLNACVPLGVEINVHAAEVTVEWCRRHNLRLRFGQVRFDGESVEFRYSLFASCVNETTIRQVLSLLAAETLISADLAEATGALSVSARRVLDDLTELD